MSAIVVALTLTTMVSTMAALAMLFPGIISNLIVHAYLLAVLAPIISMVIKIPFAINRTCNLTRLSRLQLVTAISGALTLFYGIGYRLAISSLYPELKHLGYKEITQLVWYEGLNIPSFLSLYQYLFQLTLDSPIFWRFFLPILLCQITYDWALYIYTDYFITFKDLGLGGSGATFYGWAWARFRAFVANVDVLQPPRVPQTANPWRGRLSILPQREGPRPTILGVTPQRQVDLPTPPNTMLALEELFEEFITPPGSAGPDRLAVMPSYLEPGLRALRRELTIPTNRRGGPLNRALVAPNSRDDFGGEIIHFHREGTTHVVLHPEDCRRVIEGGWGERHPFCTNAWYWRLWFNWYCGDRIPVPEYLIILYAPRHQGEVDIIREITRAAIWHATEGRLYPITANTYPIPPAPRATI